MARPSDSRRSRNPVQSFTFPTGSIVEGELKLRPRRDRARRTHRLRKEIWSFWVKEASTYLVAFSILVWPPRSIASGSSSSPDSPQEEKQWVMSILTSLLVGIVGYVFGKVTK